MTTADSLIIDVVALRRRVGTRRPVTDRVLIVGASVGDSLVVGSAVDAEVVVESVHGGVSVSGTASADWSAPCRRCLAPVTGRIRAQVSEVFEDAPTEGETWPIVDERIDLTPALREAVILALPLAPLCRESCRGPEPDRFPTGLPGDEHTAGDPRWAALDQLRFDDD